MLEAEKILALTFKYDRLKHLYKRLGFINLALGRRSQKQPWGLLDRQSDRISEL